FKVVGQVGLGIIIAWTMHDHPSIVTRQKVNGPIKGENIEMQQNFDGTKSYYNVEVKSTKTNIPFYKNNEFDYGKVLSVFGVPDGKYAFFVFLAFVVFIITAVSNGANITDGIDGLATGTSAIIGAT